MARLNDTAAVIAMTPYESQNEHYSRSVRPIDNGYVVSEHHYGPNSPDGPNCKEFFTRDHPDLKDSSMGTNANAMKRAVDYMKK